MRKAADKLRSLRKELRLQTPSCPSWLLRDSLFSYTAHAEGSNTIAIGYGTHAEGYQTAAINTGAHAEGAGAIAEGKYAHVEGLNTYAQGNYSHAGGYGTIAQGEAQTAVGRYNLPDLTALFIVGNGTADAYSNAFVVNADGTATIAAAPINDMDVATKQYVDSKLSEVLAGITEILSGLHSGGIQ